MASKNITLRVDEELIASIERTVKEKVFYFGGRYEIFLLKMN
ncbi:MAG: hypothetical protein ACTSX6_07280 [Candidatus Heimdallarchaeaceae archaeon]